MTTRASTPDGWRQQKRLFPPLDNESLIAPGAQDAWKRRGQGDHFLGRSPFEGFGKGDLMSNLVFFTDRDPADDADRYGLSLSAFLVTDVTLQRFPLP